MLITPRTLSGFKDCLPKEAMAKKLLLQKVSEVFLKFGFVPIETPHLEYAEVLIKQGSEEIQKELYRFKDRGERDVALRFDLTVPLARFISQYQSQLQLPFKRFAIGNVFRGERAQKGRYREFTQCDFDFIGSNSLSCDAEIVQVIYASLVNLGIDEFSIRINHRKILNGICKHFGITQSQDINATLRIIDKLDKIGEEGVLSELGSELRLQEDKAREILRYVSIKQNGAGKEFFESIAFLKEWNDELKEGIEDIERLYEILSLLQMDKDCYRVHFSIARGLGYYTGIVYETILTQLPSIGSVCSGGRYDNLTQTFSKQNMSGVGASIGVDRLIAAMKELSLLEGKSTSARALIVCMSEEYLAYVHTLAESFRRSGIAIEVYPDIVKLKKPFGYANTLGHEFVLVVGESEFQAKSVTLKNMTSGMQMEDISFLKALEILKQN
ncbi:histidine--tRNA ligase [uncultured Helicobacter sp.]|uniref:histidine--tRNA ligase n=1 Tax=uncultured Helicobacter sp. TaxID=175537 RepID=UPI003751A1FA